MVRSMTGFGKAAGEFNGTTVVVELSAVNHRYLDSALRLPYEWSALDPVIRDALRKRLSRGKISVTVSRKRGTEAVQTLKFDPDVARRYIEASRELGALMGTGETLSLNTLAQLEGVFYHDDPDEDLEAAKDAILAVLDEAVTRLDMMRAAEGEALARDTMHRIKMVHSVLERIEARLPEVNQGYEERLRARVRELNIDAKIAEERLAVEVAVMAEKGDVTEEVVRLKAHLDHFLTVLDGKEPPGRKLNFLLQEMQREINTLGAKARDSEITRDVLDMKSELEKIREQIQNIE